MTTTPDLRIDLSPRTPIVREAPAARRAHRARGPERYYVGRRSPDTEVYVVSRAAIEPLKHHRYRSDASFDWGVPTPGAFELAYAMLTHSTESRPPDPICVTFWTEIVACLDRPGFVLAHGEIALWLLTAFRESDEPARRRRRSLRDRVHRIRAWGRGQ